ncbi:MAG: hypothetical protein PHF25_08295 [Candidatus Margulisbacteria bacterium]|nr:hypothetical protein [Candidatus Margulisiibacteriota bacterium]
MNNKVVSIIKEDQGFNLPEIYKVLQKEIRRCIALNLRRTNGRITEDDFVKNFIGVKNVEALKQRLFVIAENGELEWKNDIISIDDLARKLGSLDKITPEIKRLFDSSKYLYNRTDYPALAPSNKKDRIRGVYEQDGPVYGFDLLIRPNVAKFHSEEGKAHNDLVLGKNCFAIVLHVDINMEGKIDLYSKSMVRYVGSAGIRENGLLKFLIRYSSQGLRSEIIEKINAGDIENVVKKVLNVANLAASNTIRVIGP